MNMLKNLFLVLLALGIALLNNICVCIYGWGLQPRSWFWIIGGYLIGGILAQGLIILTKKE